MAKNQPKDKGNDKPGTTAGQLDASNTPGADGAATTAPQSVASETSQTDVEAQKASAQTPKDGSEAGSALTAAESSNPAANAVSEAEITAIAQVQQAAPDDAGHYTVRTVPIRHDGKFYDVGQSIVLTPEQAERLGHLVATAPQTTQE
ncbi:hypothetical protein ACDW_22790 [Acidovorax sp. DW039]|uniref:DUF7210 family protein n=1 Tax=Acidovorax sp. DW039 TaxID=3095606 RepID=UPI00308549B9|nr:hypothetical protein ACDW_22790 [Acidovorax sp. DW039]